MLIGSIVVVLTGLVVVTLVVVVLIGLIVIALIGLIVAILIGQIVMVFIIDVLRERMRSPQPTINYSVNIPTWSSFIQCRRLSARRAARIAG